MHEASNIQQLEMMFTTVRVNGIEYDRRPFIMNPKMVRYWGEYDCPECGAKHKELHKIGCTEEICPVCHDSLVYGHFNGHCLTSDNEDICMDIGDAFHRAAHGSPSSRRLAGCGR